ncbi:VOC family protein [Planococcus koreensis]|uniref:VOC family protein n=1 Tax=Planococcus koreensis TaxID=112331 RepID=UPI0039FC3A27
MFLDHIVHFTKSEPAKAVEAWESYGFHAAVGGQHIQWGTHNALLYMKDCYIEWLSLADRSVAESAEHPLTKLLLHDEEGFGTVCLRTADIGSLDKWLREEGFETTGVLDAERKTGNGETIRWKMLFIEQEVTDALPAPFFIEWQQSDSERYSALRERDAIKPDNEKLSVEACVFGVHDIPASEALFRKILQGKLETENCRFEFRETTSRKERLEEVRLAGGSKRIVFEEGVYCLPGDGNI